MAEILTILFWAFVAGCALAAFIAPIVIFAAIFELLTRRK